MKRFLSIFIAICMALILPASALAEFDPDSVSTPYIVLMDANTGSVLYEKNCHDKAYPASTTKIMTAIIAIERGGLDEKVNVGTGIETHGSTMGLCANEELPLKDLIYGMMLRSGNDAAHAIAIYIAGSESAFADLMNQKAAEIGMTNTHFVKPNGLHNDDHYTTAYDMALLTRYAMQNETFRKIVSTKTYHVSATNKHSEGFDLENTNHLLYTKEGDVDYTYRYAIGVKTGDTDQAGRCLVAAAQKDGVELILVLFGDYSNKVSGDYRFQNAAQFFDWGFANYKALSACDLNLKCDFVVPVANASLDDPDGGNITLKADIDNATLGGLSSYLSDLQTNCASIVATPSVDKLTAPIKEGDTVGTVTYTYGDQTLLTANLIATRSVNDISNVVGTDDASSTPLIIDPTTHSGGGGHAYVFWILLGVLLLLLVVIAKIISVRRRRRHNAKRRSAYRSNYNTHRR